jgi:hypothetical protein
MGSDPFKLQSDGSALYNLGNGLFIYTPPDAGPHQAGDPSQIKIVDASGNPVPGYDNAAAIALANQYEGAGATYGTHEPGTGTPGEGLRNDIGGAVVGSGVGGLLGPIGSAAGIVWGANNGDKILDAGGNLISKVANVTQTGFSPPSTTGGSTPADRTADEQAARDYAKQLQDQAAARAANPTAAPQLSPVATATAPTITPGQVDIGKGPGFTPVAGYTGAPIVAPKEAAVTPGVAGSMGVGSIGAGSVTAGQIDTSKNQIDTSKNLIDLNGDARAQQQAAVDLARQAATGSAPSQAEQLFRQAIDQGAASQLGIAASLQGRNPATALRTGLAGAANVNTASAAQMAGLRADEMAKARADFLSGTGALRGQDIDIQKANQSTILSGEEANQSTVLQGSMANLSADTQAKIASLNAQTQTAIANLNAQVAAGQANLAAQTSVELKNLDAQMQKAHDDAYNELMAKINNGQINEDAWKAQMQANTSLSLAQINAEWDALKQNSINQTTANVAAAGDQTSIINNTTTANTSRDIANQSAQLAAKQLDDAFALGKGTQIIAALGLPLNASEQDIQNLIAKNAGDQAFLGKLFQLFGTLATK